MATEDAKDLQKPTGGADASAPAETTDGAPPSSAETQKTEEQAIPYERFKKVNEAKNALEKRVAELEKAANERAQAEAEAQRKVDEEKGEFKKLYETSQAELAKLKPAAQRAAEYEKAFAGMLAARLERVPDHIKTLLETMDPLAALKWLDNNHDALTPRIAPDTDAGRTGERGTVKKQVQLPKRNW